MQLFLEHLFLGGAFLINIGAIKNISRFKKCSRGTIITGDGIGNIMFIVLKGEVGVYNDYRLTSSEMISTLGTGDLFADSGLLQDKKAAHTTVALSDAIIVPIEKSSFEEFLQEEPSLAFELIKDLFLRLDLTRTEYKELIVHHASGQRRHEKKQPPMSEDEPAGASPPLNFSPPESQPLVPTQPIAEKSSFKLFPEEHGSYALLLNSNDTTHLMNRSHKCPICNGDFSALAIKPSKLVLASTDSDMRSRYKDIEPMYYEILTCPHCLYSALPDIFDKPEKSKSDIMRELVTIKNTAIVHQDAGKDADSVFAGLYLALFCAPISFTKHQLIAGKLFSKLSRVYQDAGDENMENLTAQKALESYLYAYEQIGISPVQEQQICILIGELYLKQGDLKNAISFFIKAKTSSSSTPVLKNHADGRVYDIREMAAVKR